MCSFSLRSHGHSCDRVTNTSPWNLTSFLCKYLHINMLYNYTSISLSQRSHGHSCDRVTIYQQQHYLYIVINVCISICYIFFTVVLALCGHMVTAVTMWPWLCDRECDQIVSSAISSCLINDCISMYYIQHGSLSSLTAVTRSQLWPCDRDHVTVSLWHRKMQNAQTTIRRSKVRNYLLTYALSRHETPCFVWRKMVIHGKKRCIIFALLRFLLYLCKRNGKGGNEN